MTLPASDAKPNVILIMADDLGYECLGCYGGKSYPTPHLDRLAETGIRFDYAYAQPLCTPTRVQLMTGKYNFRNWLAFGLLDPNEQTFGHYMTQAGYRTCISGKWQLYSYNPPDYEPEWRGKGTRPEDCAFDEWFLWHAEHTEEKGSRYADPVILDNGTYLEDTAGKYGPDLFVDYINDFMQRHRDEPFFVYYPMALTHGPFQPTPHSDAWENDRHDSHPKHFGDMVAYMDTLVGRIVDKVDELGLRENTLILFYGDNGSPRQVTSRVDGTQIQGGKGLSTDAGIHVPLIANWPGTAPAGQACTDLVDCSDFVPTLLELAGARLPENEPIDGVSFAPQLHGQPGSPRDWIFFHHDPLPGWGKDGYYLQRWAQDHRWKLYDDGKLYAWSDDLLERNPIPPEESDGEARLARQKLQPVLDQLQ